MSKSAGNVVEAFQLTDKYGHDAFRYFLLREMAFGLDANFTEEALVGRLNADLANDLGNLVSRATTMIVNFGGGAVPPPPPGIVDARTRDVMNGALDAPRAVDAAMGDFGFHRALASVWEFLGTVNRYIDAMQPWTLAKDPAQRARLDEVLYALAQSLNVVAVMVWPFLPEAAGKLRAAIGKGDEPTLPDATWGAVAPGTPVVKLGGLFPRIEMRAGDAAPPSDAMGATVSPSRVSIDEFAKVELRVAEVLAAEKVAKSRKLLKLTVRVGDETRTLVAGVAESYAPADLVGRKVVIVANLLPATLMGIESNGMVLAASHGGTVSLLTLDKDLPAGAKVK